MPPHSNFDSLENMVSMSQKDHNINDIDVLDMAVEALEMPYHWRMKRLETKRYIDVYNKHDLLIEFAKIDFNIVQAVHQEELKYLSRWDVNRLDELPEYMKLCYLVLHNETNGIGRDILKDKNINVIPFLRKSWEDLCKAYLVEAKWHKRRHKPSVEEYMRYAWISSSVPTSLLHFYCVFSDQISSQVLETLSQHQQHVVRCSANVLRLANDLATSPDELKRGEVFKSVQCYMNETGVSEEKACAYMKQMISDTWTEINYEKISNDSSILPRGFVEAAINLARTSQCMYQYGDGHGSPDKAKTVDRVMSLLVNPVPLD
ncbi:unnamed protein product [Microthlaspi erraticum]|uniref:Terpene synthase metal-binding domain-containing protein n=1 Tax=Microthlaspi erraticum TaxID=1685480 RepID=A0A6D2J234_9BRAS|nr:unnamed protein product [Microthlaspi erraticum]